MEDPKETLQAQATALGIEVDGRWGEARLQQEIDRAKAHQVAKDEEQDAYGNGTDDAGEHSGEGEGGTDAGGEPAGDLPVDAGADDAGSADGAEGTAVEDGEEDIGEPGDDASSEGRDEASTAAELSADGEDGGSGANGIPSSTKVSPRAANAEDEDPQNDGSGSAASEETPEAGSSNGNHPEAGHASDAADDHDAGLGALPGSGTEDHGDGSADGTSEFGGLPSAVQPLDEEGQRVAIEVARLAMTAPIVAAFNAASAMAGHNSFDASWFAREGDVGDYSPALVNVAVPFVREWPTAPVEALYSHVARAAPALRHEAGWDDLHFSHRLAWEVFRDVLVKADAAIGAETRRREAAEPSDRWGQRDVREDDTMFAPSTSREMRSDLGQARDRPVPRLTPAILLP